MKIRKIDYPKMYNLVNDDSAMMKVLHDVAMLGLNDCWIGAGFIRNKVWSYLHDYDYCVSDQDIDIVYFSKDITCKKVDSNIEKSLMRKKAKLDWSVKNQARMHVRNGHEPYTSSLEACSFWTETATSTLVKLDLIEEKIDIVNPFGFEDLFNLIIRPTPCMRSDLIFFHERLKNKKWEKKWPLLKVVV